jgi:hypothetical protein
MMHRLPCCGQSIERPRSRSQHLPDFRSAHAAHRIGSVGKRDGAVRAQINDDLPAPNEPVDMSRHVVLRIDAKPYFAHPHRGQ